MGEENVSRVRRNSHNDEVSNGDESEALERLDRAARECAVGNTMYEKRWVIENLLAVGRHFQKTSYEKEVDGEKQVVQLEEHPGIEEKLCSLWDISVEEDVSAFYLEFGALDIFVELFSNPNHRVKEIAVGIMANMLCHEKVFLGILDKQRYLEKLLRVLDVKDSPTLSLVFRCLHSYGHHLFSLLHSEPLGPRSRDASEIDPHVKEQVSHQTATWLTFLSTESVVRGIGLVVASSTNKEVLGQGSRLLSMLSSLWENQEERSRMASHYAEETFIQCVLEAVEESLGEDRTEKHFLAFLHAVFEQDLDKEVLSGMSDRLISTVNSLLKNHVLHYSCIDSGDVEFLSTLVWIIMTCLHSGGYSTLPSGLRKHLGAVLDMAEEEVEKEKESFSEGEKEEDTESDEDRRALVKQLKTCHERLKGLSTNDGH